MPKKPHLKKIMLLGSGPIVIGQACEFDYSGTQGCKALKEEGCEIVLVNSNPATVMTDPGFSDRTYIEPLTPEMVAEIIRKERPDAVLPTLGGQTGLNMGIALHEMGVLKECNVEMIGAKPEVIDRAESREHFRTVCQSIGLDLPKSGLAHTEEEALALSREIGFPAIIRPSFTLGGSGGGIAFNIDEFRTIVARGLATSPMHEVLIEESVLGWKEIELEIMRDQAGHELVICGIENLDPMGVHTGDSITVAPIMTLSKPEFAALAKEGMAIARGVGMDTGGCNVQFAVDPKTGRRVVIELNPRVSRSSALASKATGFPIARVACKLALGYTLNELTNDMTGTTACFEPSVDYHVVKIARFDFAKFKGADTTLGFQMKAVGETMAIGHNFREAFQKALRGLETGHAGMEPAVEQPGKPLDCSPARMAEFQNLLRTPTADRIYYVYEALCCGMSIDDIYKLSGIDPWFLNQLAMLVKTEHEDIEKLAPFINAKNSPDAAESALWRSIKSQGFSDKRIARLLERKAGETVTETAVRERRIAAGVHAVFKSVDTCAGVFPALASYHYSTYPAFPVPENLAEQADEKAPETGRKKIIILGGGPNRIGQGVEFDYCCVQAAFAVHEAGHEAIMINSNPETVSTDYDIADKLYFEPLTVEDILAVCRREKPDGVIIQFGGQTPLNLSVALEEAGVPVIGTKPKDIFLAESREEFSELLSRLEIPQPENGTAHSEEEACSIATRIGYPVMVRPSFVLGGRSMRIVHDEPSLRAYLDEVMAAEGVILVDRFLEDAIEVDVDALCDGETVTVAAIMEHIEQAGVHSGDSACSIGLNILDKSIGDTITEYTRRLGLALNTRGLINIQYAVQNGTVYVLEANPRASRTVPFVSKATGVPLAKYATRVMLGERIKDIGFTSTPKTAYHAVKEAVLPFNRFLGATIALGPEMRSTGEVMGLGRNFGEAFLKAQLAAGDDIPTSGAVLLSICDHDKPALPQLAKRLLDLGFTLYATDGTHKFLKTYGIEARYAAKIDEARPNLIDNMLNGELQIIVNVVAGQEAAADNLPIRSTALARKIPLFTTMAALAATIEGLEQRSDGKIEVAALQDYYAMK